MTTLWLAVALRVAAPDPTDVKPGWLGLGVVLALAVAVVLLWLSMRRQLGKIDFEEPPDPRPGGDDASSGGPPRGVDGSTPSAG